MLETCRDIWECTDDDDDDKGKKIRGNRISVVNTGSLVVKIVQKHRLSESTRQKESRSIELRVLFSCGFAKQNVVYLEHSAGYC